MLQVQSQLPPADAVPRQTDSTTTLGPGTFAVATGINSSFTSVAMARAASMQGGYSGILPVVKAGSRCKRRVDFMPGPVGPRGPSAQTRQWPAPVQRVTSPNDTWWEPIGPGGSPGDRGGG